MMARRAAEPLKHCSPPIDGEVKFQADHSLRWHLRLKFRERAFRAGQRRYTIIDDLHVDCLKPGIGGHFIVRKAGWTWTMTPSIAAREQCRLQQVREGTFVSGFARRLRFFWMMASSAHAHLHPTSAT